MQYGGVYNSMDIKQCLKIKKARTKEGKVSYNIKMDLLEEKSEETRLRDNNDGHGNSK